MNAVVDDIQSRIADIQRQEAERRVSREAEREEVKRRNREDFSDHVEPLRICQVRFGDDTRPIYLEQNGKTIGKPPTPGMNWFATTPYRRGK